MSSIFDQARGVLKNLQGQATNFVGKTIQNSPQYQTFNAARQFVTSPQVQQGAKQIIQKTINNPMPIGNLLPNNPLSNLVPQQFQPKVSPKQIYNNVVAPSWQAPAQFGAGIGLSLLQPKQSFYQPDNIFSKTLLGSGPVKNIQGQGADLSQSLNSIGINPKLSKNAGIPLVVGMGAFNLLPGGGVKNKIVKQYEPAVKNLKGLLSSKEIYLIDEFTDAIRSGKGRQDLGQLGRDIHAMTSEAFGRNAADTWSNKKVADAWQYVFKRLSESKRRVPIGLEMEDVSDNFSGAVKLKNPSLEVPMQGSKLPTIDPTIRGPQQKLLNPLDIGATRSTMNLPTANPSDTDNYIKELVKKQHDAGSSGVTSGFKQKAGSFLAEVKAKMVDETAPITDILSAAEKKHKFNVLPKDDVRLQIDRVLRSKNLASQFAEDNGLVDIIKKAPDLNALDQYMIAKQAATVAKQGKVTGRDLARDQQLIQDLAPQYEELAQTVNQYSRKLLDYSVESGIIDKKLADELVKKYPDYVPLNRVFNEIEKGTHSHNVAKGIASLSKQSVVQKLQGSEREITSPIESLLLKTQDALSQGERNKAAQMLTSYAKLPGNPFKLEALRTAENVTERREILTKLKALFQETREIDRSVSTQNRAIRKINTRKNVHGRELEKLIDQAQTMASEFEPSSAIKSILDKALTRERKIFALEGELMAGKNAKARTELISLLNDRKDSIKSLREELSNVRDITKVPGQQTITVLRNGIKEVWTTTPEVVAAAKSLNVEQMGLLGKILSTPTRALQLGATGLNVPFVVTNVLKDEITGFINSSRGAKTSLLNPSNYVRSLLSALKHDELYKDLVRNAGGGTSFDIAREAPNLSIQKIRHPLKYTVTHPLALLKAVEDTIGRSEEFGRVKNFQGYRQSLLKQGRTQQDADLLGAQAARENTANFARRGSYGRVINWTIPFFNAGIQGSRQLVRSFQKSPAQTSAKVAATIFTPIAVTTAWNMSDPERKKIYMDIPKYEKDNNIIIIPPEPKQDEKGRWNVIKIPLPPGLSNLGTIVRRSLETVEGQDPITFAEIATNLITAGTSIDVTSGNKLASTFTPQAIKPIVEAQTNTNLFTGQKIVPDYLKSQPPELQTKPGVSGIATGVGKVLGVSPLVVENFAQSQLGGLGSQLLGKETAIGNLQKRFSKSSGGDLLDKVYEDSDKAQSIKSQAKKLVEAGDKEAALNLIRSNKDLLVNSGKAKAVRSQVDTLQEYKNKVRADTRLTQEQKDKVLILIQQKLYELSTLYSTK